MIRKLDPDKITFDENTVAEDIDLDTEVVYVGGERLTEQRAQEMVTAILAKATASNLRPGGKSLSGNGKHSPVVQVRVSERTRDRLREIAKARRMSVSKLSRRVLDEFVAQHPST